MTIWRWKHGSHDPLPSSPSYEQEGFQLRRLFEWHPRQRSSYAQLHTPTAMKDRISENSPSIDRGSGEYLSRESSTTESFKRPIRFRIASWRFTIITGLSTTILVLICNIAIIAWAYATLGRDNTVMYEGSCDRMKTIDTWSHLGINVLSTLVLGASNAAMQLIVAPSREDVRKAHAQSRTVDIGIHGLRNWRFMSRRRRSIWILLLVTTIPLHLL